LLGLASWRCVCSANRLLWSKIWVFFFTLFWSQWTPDAYFWLKVTLEIIPAFDKRFLNSLHRWKNGRSFLHFLIKKSRL
jgi:hypothetical protein